MKNRYLFLLPILFLLPTIAFADVRINEIAWMGIAGTNGQYGEWLELYNDGAQPVNMAGWKIYKADTTVLFTLTKSIPAKGYLLVERTTPSLPDPIPGINDEVGPFGGGGLSNTGENLVLKDSNGSIIQSLNYASGWPAGDAVTKETMQYTGSAWITALATPKAPTLIPLADAPVAGLPPSTVPVASINTTSPTASSNPPAISTPPAPLRVIPHIEFSFPQNIHQGISYDFGAAVILEYGGNPGQGVFVWNMGDGTMVKQTFLTPVQHTYRYPGNYTITFGYYRPSYYDAKPFLRSSKTVTVTTPLVQVNSIEGNALELTNPSSTTIDLSGWRITLDDKNFTLPEMTSLAANATIVIPGSVLDTDHFTRVTIATATGFVVSTTAVKDILSVAPVIKAKNTRILRGVENYAPKAIPLTSIPDLKVEQPEPEKQNRTKHIILGAVLLFVIGLFILLERTIMVRRE